MPGRCSHHWGDIPSVAMETPRARLDYSKGFQTALSMDRVRGTLLPRSSSLRCGSNRFRLPRNFVHRHWTDRVQVPFFLSFWFQAVKGVTPATTGVNFIARVVPQFVAIIATGVLVKKFGQYMPYMVLGELICLGGLAMLTQLSAKTSTVYWAGSLVVIGLGSGLASQIPYSAISVVLEDDDIPIGNAIVLFLNQMGGALAVSLGQTIILATLGALVPQRLPDLSLQLVKDVGASDLSSLHLSTQDLTILRDIWNIAVVRVMIFATALVGAALPFTLRMEWLNTKTEAEARIEMANARAQEDAQEKSVPVNKLTNDDSASQT